MHKYITYAPWHGDINNVRLCFESVAALAYLLDRQIAIPEHLHRLAHEPAGSGVFRPLHPATFFNLEKLNVTTVAAIPAGASVYDVPAFEPDTTVIALEDAPDLSAFAGNRAMWWLPDEARDADVIALPRLLTPFYSQIFGTPETRRRAVLHIRDSVRHHTDVVDVARQIAGQLGQFHAVVIRRNEFIRAYPQSDIPAAQIMDVIAERAPAGSRLLIATDETDRRFFAPLAAKYRLAYARDWVAHARPDMDRYQLSCVVQNLCALAETFVGTRLSTFSAYVNRLRGYHDRADTSIRFTDGTHHRFPDDDAPAFSWQPSHHRNLPLWGREFREGWS